MKSSLILCLAFGILAASPAMGEGQKVLRYAIEVSETGFDPAQAQDLYSTDIISNLFDAPLRYAYDAPPGTLEPNVLTAMPDVSDDFRTFTFHLKPGIYFIDDPAFGGKKRELTAEDFVYSFKRYFDPRWNSPEYDDLGPLKLADLEKLRDAAVKTRKPFDYNAPENDIVALDRYTWRLHLGIAAPRFLNNYADAGHYGAVAREVVEKYGDHIPEHPVGTGPFKLGQWIRSSKIVLVKNPDYRVDVFNPLQIPADPELAADAVRYRGKAMPFLDRVEISVIEESQPRWLAFVNGELDYCRRVPGDLSPIAIPNNRLAPNLEKKHIRMERVANADFVFMIFNMDDPVWGGYAPAQVALRRAVGLAFDTPGLIAAYYKWQAKPAETVFMPGVHGYDATVKTEMGTMDTARANALLDTYGYRRLPGQQYRSRPDGSPLVLLMRSQTSQRDRIFNEVLKRSTDALGIRLEIDSEQWPDNLKAVKVANFVAWTLGLTASSPDADGALQNFYGPAQGSSNLSRFKLPQFDKLYEEQQQIPDGPQREAILAQMDALLLAYEPAKFIVNRIYTYMNYPWVHNLHFIPFAGDWWRYVDADPGHGDPS